MDLLKVLRFCHFPNFDFSTIVAGESKQKEEGENALLPALRILKLDLCYGDMRNMVHSFIDMCSKGALCYTLANAN